MVMRTSVVSSVLGGFILNSCSIPADYEPQFTLCDNSRIKNSYFCDSSEARGMCRCQCDAGFGARPDKSCQDRNECKEFPTLCKRNPDTRNTCKNVPGSFECSYDVENACSPANDFGGCWRQEIDGVILSSCEVRPPPPFCTLRFCVCFFLGFECIPIPT
jgi:hypothetical protein